MKRRDRNLAFERILQVSVLLCAISVPAAVAAKGGTAAPPFNGVSLSVASPIVPAGGLLQMQISLTEPKPILKGLQGVKFGSGAARTAVKSFVTSTDTFSSAPAAAPPPSPLGAVRDVALFGPGGNVSGVAVLTSAGPQIFFNSPLTTFGMNTDTPIMTISMPVNTTAVAGQTVSLALDPSETLWYGPNSKLYPTESNAGLLTVGGALCISDVTPGAGVVPAGTTIVIKGMGFNPQTQIRINEARVVRSVYVSPNEIHIALSAAFDLRGKRMRAINSGNEVATYFPSARATLVGKSNHPLVAASFPLFALTNWSTAYFHPVVKGAAFTGLAVQNMNASTASVTIQLLSKSRVLLATQKLTLGSKTRIVRDLSELFPAGSAIDGAILKVSANAPLQMLGLLGDDASGFVLPMDPAPAP